MKKILLCTIFSLAFLTVSCFNDLSIPEKVTVNTDATYNFTLGSLDSKKNESLDFSQYLDIDKMFSGTGTQGINISKYNKNEQSQYQEVLMELPIQDIDLQIGDTFKDLDVTQAMSSMNINETFTIPELANLNQEENIDLAQINDAINAGVTFTGTTNTSTNLDFILEDPNNFDSISYQNGKMVIQAAAPVGGTVSLYHNSDVLRTGTFNSDDGKVAEIDLANLTIYHENMSLKFSGNTGIGFVGIISENSIIREANGITLTNIPEVPDIDLEFDCSTPDNLEKLVIGQGSIEINVQTQPDGWSAGIISSYTVDISGAITASFNQSKTTDTLDGQEFKNEKIKAKAKINVALNNATIVFTSEPKVSVSVDITEIGEVTVKLPDDFQSNINETPEIPEDIKKYIKSIEWNECGFNVIAKNNLPHTGTDTDNQFKITLTSSFFNITNSTKNINAGGDNPEEQKLEFVNTSSFTSTIQNDTIIDVNGTIDVPGTETNKITLKGVVPGKEYYIDLKVEPVMDWAKVVLNTSFDGLSGNFNTNVNMTTIFDGFKDFLGEDFIDKLKFKSIPLYIFGEFPKDIFENPSLKGKIVTYYATQTGGGSPVKVSGSVDQYLLGTSSSDADLPLVAMPTIHKNTAGEIITDFGSTIIDMAPSINNAAKEGTMFFDYNLKFATNESGEIEITPDTIKKLTDEGSNTKISLSILMVLPFNFTITDNIEVDLMKIINKEEEGGTPKTDKEKDLFKRESATSLEDFQKYLDVVQSASVVCTKSKFPIVAQNGIDIGINMNPGEAGSKTQILRLGSTGKNSISINPTKLLNTYPLEPELKMTINKGDFCIPKQLDMETTLSVVIKTKGKVTLWDSSSQGGTN